jgi:hypothetical protein
MGARMLHITNGDSTAVTLRAGAVAGTVLAWRDVLHDGPVPAGLALAELSAVRARFIAEQGWGAYDAVLADFHARDSALAAAAAHEDMTLWFEHDLYDQLQLLQLLDWCGGHAWGDGRLSLICIGVFPGKARFLGLGELSAAELTSLFPTRHTVTGPELTLARAAWHAFRSVDPHAIETVLAGDTSPLPFLGAALTRHLEEFPATGSGLGRTERTLLEVIAAGSQAPHAIFTASQERESAPYLGDTSVWLHVRRLSAVPAHPLIVRDDGGTFETPQAFTTADAFAAQRLLLTDAGHAVLAGQADHLALNGIDRWLGGVHLRIGGTIWRWDGAQGRLVRA